MSRYWFIALIIILKGYSASAQYTFIDQGRIIFERRINTYAILPGFAIESNLTTPVELRSFVQSYEASNPRFWIDSFQLFFDRNKTFYEPMGIVSKFMHGIGTEVSHANKVVSYLLTSEYFAEKYAYNELLKVKDSIRKIKWKLTDEIREIAGYECRRANALILDSLYVIAFYTDAIITKGGPESFTGLPGMILGVVIPHYHISYFATRVEKMDPQAVLQNSTQTFGQDVMSQKEFSETVISFLNKLGRMNNWTQIFMNL